MIGFLFNEGGLVCCQAPTVCVCLEMYLCFSGCSLISYVTTWRHLRQLISALQPAAFNSTWCFGTDLFMLSGIFLFTTEQGCRWKVDEVGVHMSLPCIPNHVDMNLPLILFASSLSKDRSSYHTAMDGFFLDTEISILAIFLLMVYCRYGHRICFFFFTPHILVQIDSHFALWSRRKRLMYLYNFGDSI